MALPEEINHQHISHISHIPHISTDYSSHQSHQSHHSSFYHDHIPVSHSHINDTSVRKKSPAKRYATYETYELNWNSSSSSSGNISTDDDKIANFNDISQINDKSDDSPHIKQISSSQPSTPQHTQHTPLVEILHSPTKNNSEIDSSFTIKHVKKDNSIQSKNNGNSLHSHSNITHEKVQKEQQKEQSERKYPSPPISRSSPPPTSQPNFIQKQKNHSSIISPSSKVKNSNRKGLISKGKQQEVLVPREMSFIDPRLIAKKSLVRTQSINRNSINRPIKRGTIVQRKKLPPRNMEFSITSNPAHSNDPTDMDSDAIPKRINGLPWLPGPPKPPQLLHASLIPLPNRAQRTQRAASTNPNRVSRIIPTNNINHASRILSSVNTKRNSGRSSLDFRRKLLEESIMTSFGGIYTINSQPSAKPSIRRKTRKSSNAKLEDREARRERRRKEKQEKFSEEQEGNNNSDNDPNDEISGADKAIKRFETTRIISSRELVKKVEEESRKKENLVGPQPPPRRSHNETTIQQEHFSSLKSKTNTLSILSSPPERRSSKSENHSDLTVNSNEPPPYPIRLQSTFSSPTSLVPNSSIMVTSSSLEESERLMNKDDETSLYSLAQNSRTQKHGLLGGFFNKQPLNSSNSPNSPGIPPLSPLSPTYMSQTPTLVPTRTAPTPPILSPPPPQSPPLSPSRTQKIQSQLPRLNKNRRINENEQCIPNPEKLRKMEKFEALIASTEQSTKKPKTGIISAAISNLMPGNAGTTTTLTSPNILPINSNVDKKKKIIFNPTLNNGSNEISSSNNDEKLSADTDPIGRASLNSLATSLAESVHYRPEEKDKLGIPSSIDEDGVIRVTLTPAVCR
ncbi:5227_t:CDS:2 [Diversispora eburnea]|uniref:5227_t:CDS:1 n=1 Tax=Diversispora eburnea TaxID=1213867 RepID=A0A9N9AIY1_9GLOM|nr:5227_t:CDS:2 [Diversispora eburnea]